jgi:HK97 family phage major capsid protein
MNELQRLREKRAKKVEEAQAIFNKAKGESRSLNAEEATAYDGLMAEVRSLATDIKRAEEQEELERETAGNTQPINNHTTTEARDLSKYSLLKAVRSSLPTNKGGVVLDGIEKEMHEEAVTEARSLGFSIEGVGIPQMLLSRRDNSITMPTQPEDGGVLVEKTNRPVIDLLRPKTVLRALGVTYLTGLVGNIGVPTMTQGATSTWKKEVEELDKSNQKFSSTDMSPNRLGTVALRSKQFLLQTSPQVSAMLARDLENSIVQAVELGALNGAGVAGDPLTGLFNTAGVNQVVLGANGGVPTHDLLVALEAAIEAYNIAMSSPGYLINTQTKAKLKTTKIDAGSGLFLLNGNTELNGYPFASTSLVPNNLSKGSAANSLSAMAFGDWSNLLIGQWGGLDITTDPYTLASVGQIRIIIQSFWDSLVQQAKAFAIAKDVVTTPGS